MPAWKEKFFRLIMLNCSRCAAVMVVSGFLATMVAAATPAVPVAAGETEHQVFQRAGAKLKSGDTKGAIKELDKAVTRWPQSASSFLNRGTAYRKLATEEPEAPGKKDALKQALADFGQAIALDPKATLAYLGRGVTRASQAELFSGESAKAEVFCEMAESDFNKVIELDPTNRLAYLNRGKAREKLGGLRWGLAEAGFEKQHAGLPRTIAKYKVALGDFTGAIADWTKAGELDPKTKESLASKIELVKSNRESLDEQIKTMANLQAYNEGVETTHPSTPAPAADPLVEKAEGGDAAAMLQLGLKLGAADKTAAKSWIERAAEAGNPEAKFRMGLLLIQGVEMPVDRPRGTKYLTESADAGYGPAQYELGRLLVTGGSGVTPEPARGIDYLTKAAVEIPQAADALGEIYERGVSVSADRALALKWYQKAQAMGLPVGPKIQRLQRTKRTAR